MQFYSMVLNRLMGLLAIFCSLVVLTETYPSLFAQEPSKDLLSATATKGSRTWTSKNGATVQASLLSVKGNKMTLARKKDGKSFEVNLSQFSDSDQAYVKEWQSEKVNGETTKNVEKTTENKKPAKLEFVDNFSEKWPELVKLNKDFDINTISEEDGAFIYESRHFTFQADARLQKSVVKRFAEIFEATLEYCKVLPISSQLAINHTAENKKKIYLFANRSGYYQAGGLENSAGVYMWNGRNDKILVGLPFLGLKKVGSGYSLDRDSSLGVLPHEITHMFTDKCYYRPGAMGWFSEGLAEYVSNTPYRGAKYMVKKNRSYIVESVTGYGKDGNGGSNLGEEITVGSLERFMLQSYEEFRGNANFNYGMGCLMVYYFFHFDGEGERKAINAFLQALQQGKQGKEALEALLQGRTMLELEQQVTKAWRSRGIKIKFSQ